ncbi:MAG TPA: PPC domain-containing DNA-binding protein [Bryobacteraceae bacterium]|nr:PPC domain-containing DNA-binding protein [Bryobacteraceae bacterium]
MTRPNPFLYAVLFAGVAAFAADPPAPRVFGPSQVQEVYRIVLDRDALLLESINEVIKQKNIQDGHVMITAGSVQECNYHYVTSTATKPKDEFKNVKGAFEILNSGGIIADGQPHIHITLSAQDRPAFGGHLEKGCRILYLGEVTITKYSGPSLTRKPNQNGITLLDAK